MNWYNRLWIAKTAGAEEGPVRRDLALFLQHERVLGSTLPPSPDPFLLLDMEAACRRLALARTQGEKILIHGDYDVDGLSSTALLSLYLNSLGLATECFIPHRLDDGYGLSESGIAAARQAGASLVLTVDCGIRSVAEIEQLKALGIDTIITDHHEPGDLLPDAVSVTDPKRPDDPYPFKDLAGAGVALQLTRALDLQLFGEIKERPVLEALAMLGTVADVMPLAGENRRIVLAGLEAVKAGLLPGVTYLLESNRMNRDNLTAKDLAFGVCPKLNAAGRMGDAAPALSILLSREPEEIQALAAELERLNGLRREEEARVMNDLEALLARRPEQLALPILLLKGDDFHPGVLGIAAARVKERYHKSAIVFTKAIDESDERGVPLLKGSGRTAGSFDLLACLSRAADLLNNYGGHVMACGVSLAEDRWDDVNSALLTAAAEQQFLLNGAVKPADVDYVSFYDVLTGPEVLRTEEYEQLKALEPFGKGNEEPLCLFTGLEILDIRILGRDNTHLRLTVRGPEGPVQAIGFGMAAWASWLRRGDLISLAGTLSLNEWQGRRSIQILAEDILLPGESGQAVPALAGQGSRPAPPVLRPADIVSYWKLLDRLLEGDYTILSLKRVPFLLPAGNNCTYTLKQVESMHEIFLEAGLLEELAMLNKYTRILRRSEPDRRVKLSETRTWQALLAEGGLEV